MTELVESDAEWRERLVFENECKRFFMRITRQDTRRLDLPASTVAYEPLNLKAGIAANERLIQNIDNQAGNL